VAERRRPVQINKKIKSTKNMNDFPYPKIKSLEKLHVSDGLMINSERWQLAHEYHQHRQSLQYQSLFLPGIVCGLAVAPIAAPEDLPAKFRDGRWVQIQPGIAIDLYGNFIIVPQPVDFRIATDSYDRQCITVYLVLSYVDPVKLRRSANANEILVETFRINEKTDILAATDIEICRLAIAEGTTEITKPINVFAPDISQLDMRHRQQAKLRPQNFLRIACCADPDNKHQLTQQNFKFLGQALADLAPDISLADPIEKLEINTELVIDKLITYQLIYLTREQIIGLDETTETILQESLQQYVAMGGVVVIEASIRNSKLENLLDIQYELQSANTKLKKQLASQSGEQSDIQSELQSELEAIAIEVNLHTTDLLDSISAHIPTDTPLTAFSDLDRTHPLRSQPFLFSSLAAIADQPIQLLSSGGVIVILGDLSPIWGGQSEQELTRQNIRTCQELGVNILNYAAQRYAMGIAMQLDPNYIDGSKQPENDQRRVTNMVDNAV
jgi:hypothetical protein